MANPHNRKPIYYRSANPGLGNVDEIASKVFQFDETGSKPAEVLTGVAVMPPQQALNEILVWSDSNTLGYAGIPDAPMFWGDGGVGGEKIMQMINHVAGRKSGLQFYELEPAKTWILSQDDIYTNLLPPLSGGVLGYADITVEVRNSQNNFALDSFYFNQGLPQAVLYGTHGDSPLNNPVAWLPMIDGDSQTITNVPIVSYNNMPSINWQMNFWYSYNGVVNAGKYFTYYHNGVHQPRSNWYTSTSISSGFTAPAPGLQNGDEIKFIISDVPGVAPFTAGSGSSSTPSVINNSDYMRIASTSSITANGQVRFSAPNPTNGGVVQITRYDANGVDYATQLSSAIANKVAGSSSNTSDITIGFNVELDSSGNVESVLTGTYGWGMTYAAYDTSTLPAGTTYYNVANPTLKTINGIEVYEFVGSMDTGYSTAAVTDSGTPEPILVSLRHS